MAIYTPIELHLDKIYSHRSSFSSVDSNDFSKFHVSERGAPDRFARRVAERRRARNEGSLQKSSLHHHSQILWDSVNQN